MPTPKFPLLAKLKAHSTIVLFTNETTGMVVSEGSGGYSLGRYSQDWGSCFNDNWTVLHTGSKVELTVG